MNSKTLVVLDDDGRPILDDPWWTAQRQHALNMALEKALGQTDAEWADIAKMIGVERRTLYGWRHHPMFVDAFTEIVRRAVRPAAMTGLLRRIRDGSDAAIKMGLQLTGDLAPDGAKLAVNVGHEINIVSAMSDAELAEAVEEEQRILDAEESAP